jgi:hypothetical protein
MFGRTRRLKEISAANQPVFGSGAGNQWWLASAPGQPAAPVQVNPVEERSSTADQALLQSQPVAAAHLPADNSPAAMNLLREQPAAEPVIPSSEPNERSVAWDPQAGCFVSAH